MPICIPCSRTFNMERVELTNMYSTGEAFYGASTQLRAKFRKERMAAHKVIGKMQMQLCSRQHELKPRVELGML